MKVAPTLINFKYTLDVPTPRRGRRQMREPLANQMCSHAGLSAACYAGGTELACRLGAAHASLSIRPRESEVMPASGPLSLLHTSQFVDALLLGEVSFCPPCTEHMMGNKETSPAPLVPVGNFKMINISRRSFTFKALLFCPKQVIP